MGHRFAAMWYSRVVRLVSPDTMKLWGLPSADRRPTYSPYTRVTLGDTTRHGTDWYDVIEGSSSTTTKRWHTNRNGTLHNDIASIIYDVTKTRVAALVARACYCAYNKFKWCAKDTASSDGHVMVKDMALKLEMHTVPLASASPVNIQLVPLITCA